MNKNRLGQRMVTYLRVLFTCTLSITKDFGTGCCTGNEGVDVAKKRKSIVEEETEELIE